MEGIILALKTNDQITMWLVRDHEFTLIAGIPGEAQRAALEWLERHGNKRVIAFEQDDGISGLYSAGIPIS